MTKRIPIKALRDLSKQYGIEHAILFAHTGGALHHVVTYGRTKLGCSQAADFGNKLKAALGWPPALQSEPARVKKLQSQVKHLQYELLERKTFSIAELKNKYFSAFAEAESTCVRTCRIGDELIAETVPAEQSDEMCWIRDYLNFVEDHYNKEHTEGECQ
jgi:hypothetical protein